MPQEGVDTTKEGRAPETKSLRKGEGGMVNICSVRYCTDLTFQMEAICLVFLVSKEPELRGEL